MRGRLEAVPSTVSEEAAHRIAERADGGLGIALQGGIGRALLDQFADGLPSNV
jgi:hypothetical protein